MQTIKKEGYSIEFIEEIKDDFFVFEMESKGYFYGCSVELDNGSIYHLNFYDATRFYQDASDEISEYDGYFYEENVVLLDKVTIENMIKTIDKLYKKNIFSKMISSNYSDI